MKSILAVLSAIAAITLLGSCDSHPWSKTKVLHEKFQDHGSHADHDAHGKEPAKH